MSVLKHLPAWLDARSATAAAIAGVILFAVSYAADAIMYVLKIPAALTITDNLAIAVAGAALLLIFLFRRHEHEIVARAKERAIIVAEMNHHIRNAMTPLILAISVAGPVRGIVRASPPGLPGAAPFTPPPKRCSTTAASAPTDPSCPSLPRSCRS